MPVQVTAALAGRLDSGSHFDSASMVKVTILGTLLRDAQAAHRPLTARERRWPGR